MAHRRFHFVTFSIVAGMACLMVAILGSGSLHAETPATTSLPLTIALAQDSEDQAQADANAAQALRDRVTRSNQGMTAPTYQAPPDPNAPASAGLQGAGDDQAMHAVVVNQQGQYSIWRADRELPFGWTETGVRGTRQQCQDYIQAIQPGGRPLS